MAYIIDSLPGPTGGQSKLLRPVITGHSRHCRGGISWPVIAGVAPRADLQDTLRLTLLGLDSVEMRKPRDSTS